MNLIYSHLKKIFPEINKAAITPARALLAFREKGIEFQETAMRGAGCCLTEAGREYVFLRQSLASLLFHETLCYEGVHAFCHAPAPFLRERHNLEAEVLSLVMMMPLSDLPRLNRIKHQLDDESYELLMRRNKANQIWSL